MRAEQNAIEAATLRLRRDHRRLHVGVTALLVYVSLIMLWVAGCDPFEASGERRIANLSGGSTHDAAKAIGPAPSALASAGPASVSFTLPGGGALAMSVPANVSGADAAFAAEVVDDYLTVLVSREKE